MAAEYKDYYQTLGVSRDAEAQEVKRAFRRLARQYHPDINPGDAEAEEKFKEINEAYEVLSDPDKRAKYDEMGAQWQRYQQRGGQPGGFDWRPGAGGEATGRTYTRYTTPEDIEDLFGGQSPFSDFFRSTFGGVQGQRPAGGFEGRMPPRRGQDFEQEVEITLREAYQGTTRVLEKEGRRLEIRIPPGARTGTRVRVAGEGGRGIAGGEQGDLYLRVHVIPDSQFERQGDDLYEDVEVDLFTAVLGGETRVPTMNGAVMLSIPGGTQNGQAFRLRGQGMPHLREPGERGDLYARVDVRLPTELTPEEEALFKDLRRVTGGEAAEEGAAQP